MIMILKTPGSQMGSPAAAEEGGEAMGGGMGESEERSEVQARSTLTSTAPKAKSRSREGAILEDFAESVIQITNIGIVVVVIGHHSARTHIGMPVYDGDIRAYIGFLVDTVKTRRGTTSRDTRRGAVIRCLTLRRQAVTTACHGGIVPRIFFF